MIYPQGNVAAAGLMLGHSMKSRLTANVYAYLSPEMADGMLEGVERVLAEVGQRLDGDADPVIETDDEPADASVATAGESVGKWSDRGVKRHSPRRGLISCV